MRWAGLLLALITISVSARAQSASTGSTRLDGIAAVVNDDVVLESDVEEQLAGFLSQSRANPDSATVDTLRRQILNKLIDDKLILAEAKRQGIVVSDVEVNRQVDQAIADAKTRFGGDDGFRRQLAQENLTEDKLRAKYQGQIRDQMLGERLVSKLVPRKTVTATEAEAYYKANRAKFPHAPAEARLQVIQIPAAPDSATELKMKNAALAVRKRILAGEKFAKVAAEVSDDPGTARSGGDLGFFPRGVMEQGVENAAFTLKPGELSQPVRSTFGWHIVEPIERDTMKTRAGKDSTDSKGKPVIETHARHILIRVPVSDADAERARKLAERVQSEAIKGTDFATLVHRYSKYAGQQTADGDLGFVSMATLQPNIRAGLDTLEVGQVSEVLINPIGFNIFKVVDRKPEREYAIEEIRGELPDAVGEMKQRDRVEDWVKTLRAKAHIEIKRS